MLSKNGQREKGNKVVAASRCAWARVGGGGPCAPVDQSLVYTVLLVMSMKSVRAK